MRHRQQWVYKLITLDNQYFRLSSTESAYLVCKKPDLFKETIQFHCNIIRIISKYKGKSVVCIQM